jgi:hypothetical protein
MPVEYASAAPPLIRRPRVPNKLAGQAGAVAPSKIAAPPRTSASSEVDRDDAGVDRGQGRRDHEAGAAVVGILVAGRRRDRRGAEQDPGLLGRVGVGQVGQGAGGAAQLGIDRAGGDLAQPGRGGGEVAREQELVAGLVGRRRSTGAGGGGSLGGGTSTSARGRGTGGRVAAG